jgi:cytochrome c oxidase cbb3-type subunit 3
MYTLSLRRHDVPGTYLPRDRVRVTRFGEREFTADGPTIFGAFCAGCHGLQGQGRRSPGMTSFPSIGNPDFLNRAPDALIRETIRQGRPGRRMPAWDREGGLRAEEIASVADYLRSLGDTPVASDARAPRWVAGDAVVGRQLFETACSGCHGLKGQGGEGPALNNPILLANATDSYLVETITGGRRGTAMAGFGESAPTHRSLSESEIGSIVTYLRTWEAPKGGGKK